MRLRTSPEADRDIYGMHEYGSLQFGVGQADRYLEGLLQALELIGKHPLLAPERIEVRPPVRVYPYKAHHIFYDTRDDDILVVRVLHHTADWMALI